MKTIPAVRIINTPMRGSERKRSIPPINITTMARSRSQAKVVIDRRMEKFCCN